MTYSNKAEMMKAYTAHIIAIALVLLLSAVSLASILGGVDLSNAAVSLFVGSLVGLIAGLLSSPLFFYYGMAPNLPGDGNDQQSGARNGHS